MAALFVFLTAFATYAWTASPVMGWLDSPEFVASSAALGVPHSPGHPLPVLLGKLGALVPVGDVAFRVNLISATAVAGVAAGLQRLGHRLADVVAPALSPRARGLVSTLAALAFALTWSAWFQGVRAEVYALTGLLVVALLAALVRPLWSPAEPAPDAEPGWRPPDPRPWYAAGLWAGLALATHHFIALTVVVPGVLAGLARRPTLRAAAMTCALIILGLASFLYLPVRSAQHPEVNWGAPHTAERFAWTVSARAFHKATLTEHASSHGEDAAQVLSVLAEQATWPMALAALLGLYLAARQRQWRLGALLLGGMLALPGGGRVLIGFNPETPDDHGYLLPALIALFLLAVIGLTRLAHEVRTARPAWARSVEIVLVLGLVALIPAQVVRFGPAASMAQARGSDATARWELQDLPPRTLLLPAYFQTSFRLWTLRAVEDARPDVAILDRSFLTYPGMADEARGAYPELAALIDAPLRAGAPTPLSMLADLARQRPVMIQPHPNLEPEVGPWLLPAGAFARLGQAPPDARERERAEPRDIAQRRELMQRALGPDGQVPPGDFRGLRDALLWHDFVRLGLYCRLGRLHTAQTTLDDALKLAPGDSMLSDLATRCGLTAP